MFVRTGVALLAIDMYCAARSDLVGAQALGATEWDFAQGRSHGVEERLPLRLLAKVSRSCRGPDVAVVESGFQRDMVWGRHEMTMIMKQLPGWLWVVLKACRQHSERLSSLTMYS